MVKRLSHANLVHNQIGVKRRDSQLNQLTKAPHTEEKPQANFKVHTNRGGQIQINPNTMDPNYADSGDEF